MLEWLIALSFQYANFGSVKNDIYNTFAQQKDMDDAGNH